MWLKIVMFLGVCAITYVLRKLLSSKPNKTKFYSKIFLFYFLSSCVAIVFLPIFLLRPKDVRNANKSSKDYDRKVGQKKKIILSLITVASRILKHITKLYDLRWELRNGHVLAEERGAVIVSNHQSSFDVLGMFNVWEVGDKITAIARKEVFYVWPFGLGAYLAGVVFIDRSKPQNAYKQLEIISDVMVKKKTKIWLFPEGTRNKDYTKLLPFKRGAFKIAVNAQVPIIPILYSPYYFINSKKYLFNKGHVIINCLEPVPTKGLTIDDIPDLTRRVHDMMQAEYRKLCAEVLDDLPPDYPLAVMHGRKDVSSNHR